VDSPNAITQGYESEGCTSTCNGKWWAFAEKGVKLHCDYDAATNAEVDSGGTNRMRGCQNTTAEAQYYFDRVSAGTNEMKVYRQCAQPPRAPPPPTPPPLLLGYENAITIEDSTANQYYVSYIEDGRSSRVHKINSDGWGSMAVGTQYEVGSGTVMFEYDVNQVTDQSTAAFGIVDSNADVDAGDDLKFDLDSSPFIAGYGFFDYVLYFIHPETGSMVQSEGNTYAHAIGSGGVSANEYKRLGISIESSGRIRYWIYSDRVWTHLSASSNTLGVTRYLTPGTFVRPALQIHPSDNALSMPVTIRTFTDMYSQTAFHSLPLDWEDMSSDSLRIYSHFEMASASLDCGDTASSYTKYARTRGFVVGSGTYAVQFRFRFYQLKNVRMGFTDKAAVPASNIDAAITNGMRLDGTTSPVTVETFDGINAAPVNSYESNIVDDTDMRIIVFPDGTTRNEYYSTSSGYNEWRPLTTGATPSTAFTVGSTVRFLVTFGSTTGSYNVFPYARWSAPLTGNIALTAVGTQTSHLGISQTATGTKVENTDTGTTDIWGGAAMTDDVFVFGHDDICIEWGLTYSNGYAFIAFLPEGDDGARWAPRSHYWSEHRHDFESQFYYMKTWDYIQVGQSTIQSQVGFLSSTIGYNTMRDDRHTQNGQTWVNPRTGATYNQFPTRMAMHVRKDRKVEWFYKMEGSDSDSDNWIITDSIGGSAGTMGPEGMRTRLAILPVTPRGSTRDGISMNENNYIDRLKYCNRRDMPWA